MFVSVDYHILCPVSRLRLTVKRSSDLHNYTICGQSRQPIERIKDVRLTSVVVYGVRVMFKLKVSSRPGGNNIH
jgi:hypothetical protein